MAQTCCRPFSTYVNLGKEDMIAGSGSPAEICQCRMAAKYDLTDAGWSPASAKWPTNRQAVRSVIGRGSTTAALQNSKYLFLPEAYAFDVDWARPCP